MIKTPVQKSTTRVEGLAFVQQTDTNSWKIMSKIDDLFFFLHDGLQAGPSGC